MKNVESSTPANTQARSSRGGAKKSYTSPLRVEQARLTRMKIEDALFDLFRVGGNSDCITYKAVAERAALTEMTVYRHFPDRSALMKALWEKINRSLGEGIAMPESAQALLNQHSALHLGFDSNPAISRASIMSPQGREMRASLNEVRQKAFLKIVQELNPRLGNKESKRIAAIIQLLHSAYAWDSLQQQWQMSGAEISQATYDAMTILMNHTVNARKT